MNRFTTPVFAALVSIAPAARAQYAPPPSDDHAYTVDDRYRSGGSDDGTRGAPRRSFARWLTGPALRLGNGSTLAGLLAAADIGPNNAGLRLSGVWVGTGNDHGFAAYDAELWMDLSSSRDWVVHPIVAAGAGLARVDHRSATNESKIDTNSVAIALLRATLQYPLPVEGVDARAGIDVTANVRASGSRSYAEPAWATVAATVGLGF